MRTFVLATDKPWHSNLYNNLQKMPDSRWIRLVEKAELSKDKLEDINPEFVFFPHWSHIIPKSVFSNFKCVVFHMTDLPFGRGGSPLQNLIVKGYNETKISAIAVEEGIDTGPVYLKKSLSLLGTAEEIFIRASGIIEKMIREIIEQNFIPKQQIGEPEIFKRRNPENGNLIQINDLEKIYDFIRMLDCEGYPNAFLETEYFRFEFTRASLKSNETILADVRIIKK